ncbi:MAG: FAD:protein FMN transferase [Bacteroides sp.]|nr:FAD:protein FMN transferase [Bacteroides sp.]
MIKKANIIKVSALLTVFFCLTACGYVDTVQPVYQTGFISMDTYISLTVYGDNGEAAAKECKKEIERLEALLSVTDPDSEVSAVNASEGKPVTVSEDTAAVIGQALLTAEESGGAIDITLRPVIKEWGFTTGDYGIPEPDTLKRLLENVSYKAVQLKENTVQLPRDFQIDLGAAAKGYAGDKAAEALKACGVTSAVLNLGGNVRTIGEKPDGTAWNVAVRNPFDESNLCVLQVREKAIVTSGNYERYFEDENGVRYHHIIDPADGYPADNGIASATVIGDNGTECDALSTAIFVMGREKAEKLWREKGSFEMLLVTDNKEIFVTEGIFGSFSDLSGFKVNVIKN